MKSAHNELTTGGEPRILSAVSFFSVTACTTTTTTRIGGTGSVRAVQ